MDRAAKLSSRLTVASSRWRAAFYAFFQVKILLLNQTFHPDVASTAQHLSELALGLAGRGHEVTVVTSRRAYDNPDKYFSRHETWRGIRIIRIGSTGFGKGAKWKRAADFASFLLLCSLRIVTLPRFDVVLALTSPPLISFLGAWVAKLRGSRFFYWVMDFNPDEAIAAGWLRAGSPAARLLDAMSRFSLRRAQKIIALDRFMQERICAKGIAAGKIAVLPPWSHDDEVGFDEAGRNRFRQAHGLEGKFVVMYSGNHSPCHPLDTLMQAAEHFAGDKEIVFCFVGGGSEFKKVKAWAGQGKGVQVVCLPYQPLDQLAGSLSAADLHVVVMGNPFVGLVHPCKIYNILGVGVPALYIGPKPSHVSEVVESTPGAPPFFQAGHGEVDRLVNEIERARALGFASARGAHERPNFSFSKAAVLPRLIAELESA